MATRSKQRRQVRRWVAARNQVRQELKQEFYGPLAPKCARCKSGLAQGEGSMCHFWHGVAKGRKELFALVCSVCRHELIRTGPGGGPKMHGQAYLARHAQANRTVDFSTDALSAMEVLHLKERRSHGPEASRIVRAMVGNSPLKKDADFNVR